MTDTSALRALQKAMMGYQATDAEWTLVRVVEDEQVTYRIECDNGTGDVADYLDPDVAAYIAALVNAAPDLLDEIDQLREQVARVEAWHGWSRTTDAPNEALAAPAEGGE